MSHFKLVSYTDKPTRYTKVIFAPGKDTRYVRQYQETDYVSRYTKQVTNSISWSPRPEPEYEPLAVAENGGSNWLGNNVYEVGETVSAKTAAYE